MKYLFIFFITVSFLFLMNITVGFALEDDNLKEAIAITKPGVVIVASITAVATEFKDGSQEIIPVGSIGTGFTVSSNYTGTYIVTCAHVLTFGGEVSPDKVGVVFPQKNQNKAYYVKIVECNTEEDIAILRIPATNIPTLRLKEPIKTVEQGESVVAMGFPKGAMKDSLGVNATTGIISATSNPQIGSQLIRTSAAINPGNSGGPLIDTSGKVIGMVNAKAAKSEGIAYAIPVNSIWNIMREKNVTNEPGEVDILFMNGVKAFREAEQTWFFKNSKYNRAKEHFKEVQQKCVYHQGAAYYLSRFPNPRPWPLRAEFIVFFSVGIFFILILVAALALLKPKAICPYCGRTIERSWGGCPDCAQRLGRELDYSLSGDGQGDTTVKRQEGITDPINKGTPIVQSGPAQATLLVKSGAKQGSTYEISKPEVLIGRNENCDIVLNDGKVSAQHAKIIRQEGRFVIIDASSTNGTFLNEVRISRSNLQDGDELRMGDIKVVFREIKL